METGNSAGASKPKEFGPKIRMDAETHRKLGDVCSARGMTMAAVIRAAIHLEHAQLADWRAYADSAAPRIGDPNDAT